MPALPSLMLLSHAVLLLALSSAGAYLVIRTALAAHRALGVLAETRALHAVTADLNAQALGLLQRLADVVAEAEGQPPRAPHAPSRLH